MRNWDTKAAEQDVSKQFNTRWHCDRSPFNFNGGNKSLMQKIRQTKLSSSTDQRKNPFSPFHSSKSFEDLKLRPQLLQGVYEMGFTAPSKIQETAIPILIEDPPRNMIAQSQSGTGKTAAFVLSMLSRVDPSLNYPQVLCIAPTYELAIQIGEIAARLGQFYDELSFRYAVKGESELPGKKITDHVIIGTPDKVLDWANKFLELNKIKVFVLDEADVMISTKGYQDESFHIRRHLPSNCQIMFFSATYDDKIMQFALNIVPNPVLIRLKRDEEFLDNIIQYYVICEHKDEKYAAAVNVCKALYMGQAIFFCQATKGASDDGHIPETGCRLKLGRKTAEWLTNRMVGDGYSVALLSGDFSVQKRISVLDKFRDGRGMILITTSVLARGIDIKDVTIVVNIDVPVDAHKRADCQTYLHRIGRTGRFGKTGLAITLISSNEYTVIEEIEGHFGIKMASLEIDHVDV